MSRRIAQERNGEGEDGGEEEKEEEEEEEEEEKDEEQVVEKEKIIIYSETANRYISTCVNPHRANRPTIPLGAHP